MIVRNVLGKWFEEQLNFSLSNGSESATVSIGTAVFSPIEILSEFASTYEQEFNYWLYEDWKPRQHELRETLLSYSANGDRYLDLQHAILRQQVVPFVGSGMSVPSGLPMWAAFLMEKLAYAQCSPAELKSLIDSSSFEEAADLLEGGMSKRLLAERIEHDLRIVNPSVIDGAVCLLPGLFTNLVITTNLDEVLELLYQSCDTSFEYILSGREIADYRQLKSPNDRFLLKLHGDYRNRNGQVLVSAEYEEAYGPGSTVREELTNIYRNHSLLFMGCSLGPDRTIRLIEEVATADANMPKHYAFLEKPQDDSERIDRENFLTDRGIYPIWYDLPHDEAIMSLLDGLNMGETT